jgi:hypothetical protein
MEIKMQEATGKFLSLICVFISWLWMKFFLLISAPSWAEFASFCVIISAMWTIIANSGKAIENITTFYEWFKKQKEK